MSNNYYDFYIWDIITDEMDIIKNYIQEVNKQIYKRKELIKVEIYDIDKEITHYNYILVGYKISVCGYNDKQIINSFLKAFQKGIYINFYCVKRGE